MSGFLYLQGPLLSGFLYLSGEDLLQRVERFVDLADAVVVHRTDAYRAARVVDAERLRDFDGVVVATPDEDILLGERRRDMRRLRPTSA